jgi:hypothetical protein
MGTGVGVGGAGEGTAGLHPVAIAVIAQSMNSVVFLN